MIKNRNILISMFFSPLLAYGWQADRDVTPQKSQPHTAEQRGQAHYLKTNVIGLGMLVGNMAWEYRFDPRWSVVVPIYYSGWNYFDERRKFRCLVVQPEMRYWWKVGGGIHFFSGLHIGTGYYNVALPSWDYRIQDSDGKSPAINGGISIGCRHSLSASGNWQMEYSVGAGYSYLHFDRFYNVHNGTHYNTESKHQWGIDQVNISVLYRLPLKKKKGGNHDH